MIDANVEGRGAARSDAWGRRLGMLALAAIGLLVFEVSANASLGVAIACLKFAWDDARDGAWLRRVDPDRRRGRACSWMYLGVGLLKASLTAYLGAVAMAVFAYHFGGRLGWPPRLLTAQLLGAVGVGGFGMVSSTFASLIAVVIACRSGSKLWVGPEPRRARERGDWPPRIATDRVARRNRIGTALIVMITGMVAAACLLLFAFVGLIIAIIGPGLRPAGAALGLFIGIGLPIGSALFGLAIRDVLRARVIAGCPAECWPEAILRFPIASVDDLE